MGSDSAPIKERPTPTIENYLSKILEMQRNGEEVIGLRLAQALNVAAPTVSATLKRMERDGWITTKAQKGLRLTKAGKDAASSILRRHMLAEWMLTGILNIPWANAHAEADQIEHSISERIETQIRKNLDNPQFCPHGNPLPGNESATTTWIPLTDIPARSKVIIRRIHEFAENNQDLLLFLEKNKVLPGMAAEVMEVQPINQTIQIKLNGNKVTLGFSVAKYIHCEKISPISFPEAAQ